VTVLGIVTFNNPEFWNAEAPIFVTLAGIVRLARAVQPPKADKPIVMTLLGITKFVRPLAWKVRSTIVVTLFGRDALLKYVQPENAPLPILVTLLGMITLVMFVREAKALLAIPTTGRKSIWLGTMTAPPDPV
jgi:hypothetical protein